MFGVLMNLILISKFNKEFRFFVYVIDIFNKYAWIVSLKDKKGTCIVNAFKKILGHLAELHSTLLHSMELHSARKPSEIWVVKGSEFYNSSFKKWVKDKDIEMYSLHNKGNYVVAETFIRTLKG